MTATKAATTREFAVSESAMPLSNVIRWLLYPLVGADAWVRTYDLAKELRPACIVGVEGFAYLRWWEDEPPDEDAPGDRYSVDELVLRGAVPDPLTEDERPAADDPRDVVFALLRPLDGRRVTPDGDTSHWATLRFPRGHLDSLRLRIRWNDGLPVDLTVSLDDIQYIRSADHRQDAA